LPVSLDYGDGCECRGVCNHLHLKDREAEIEAGLLVKGRT